MAFEDEGHLRGVWHLMACREDYPVKVQCMDNRTTWIHDTGVLHQALKGSTLTTLLIRNHLQIR
jgi:hypothetical protein